MQTTTQNDKIDFSNFFGSMSSGGDEELLKVASKHAMQLTARQIRCLNYINWWADTTTVESDRVALRNFIIKFLEYKQNNNSANFVMVALNSISLRRFLNENSVKVNVEK